MKIFIAIADLGQDDGIAIDSIWLNKEKAQEHVSAHNAKQNNRRIKNRDYLEMEEFETADERGAVTEQHKTSGVAVGCSDENPSPLETEVAN